MLEILSYRTVQTWKNFLVEMSTHTRTRLDLLKEALNLSHSFIASKIKFQHPHLIDFIQNTN